MDTIDRNELREKLDRKEIILVDVRGVEAYDEEHIPGSINVPLSGFPDNALLSLKKTDSIVVYCGSLECTASPTAKKQLIELGFTNVRDYEEGIAGWKQAGFATVCPACL